VRIHTGEVFTFDAVAVCNGHYNIPYVPDILGLREYAQAHPGSVTHAKNYRRPELFKGKNILVVGGGYSGNDIAREIVHHAASVTQSVYPQFLSAAGQIGVKLRGPVKSIGPHLVSFDDDGGDIELPNAIIVCTGYLYSFPFLHVDPPVGVNGRRLHNIAYECLYAPNPTLAFLGLPYKIVPFPLCEVQAKFIAYCWKGYHDHIERNEGTWSRPSVSQLQEEVALRSNGGREVHYQAAKQWDYQDQLAEWYKGEKTELWRIEMRSKIDEYRTKYLGR